MREFNQEDYELVKDYEKDFINAIDSRFCTGLTKEELDVVSRIYQECLHRQANLSCSGCVLQMMTSVGRLYFGYLRKIEEEARKAKEEEMKNKEKKTKSRRKKNEDQTEYQTGEGMPVTL